MKRGATSGVLVPTGTVTIPAVQINAGVDSQITNAVPGAVVGMVATCSPRTVLDTGLVIAHCRVSAANQVEVNVFNPTAGNITPAAPIICDVEVSVPPTSPAP